MARTDITEVRKVLPSWTTLEDCQIQVAIDAASCMVDKITGISDDCLRKVETYLAAHFAAATEMTLSLTSETDACSGSRVTYGWKPGTGILGSPYGQMANSLSCGQLAEFDKQPTGLYSIGSIGDEYARVY